jgi:hypothetical protein
MQNLRICAKIPRGVEALMNRLLGPLLHQDWLPVTAHCVYDVLGGTKKEAAQYNQNNLRESSGKKAQLSMPKKLL